MAKSNPPNRGGSGPKVTKQGKSGPIIKSHSLNMGSNGSSKPKHNVASRAGKSK